MRVAWCALGLCVLASGCGLVQRATCNLAFETRRCLDSATVAARYKRWAREAWAHACAEAPGPCSPHFAQGFMDGFLDYVEAGGSGEPPVIPPRQFWSAKYQTPEGRMAIDDWFAGFRHGAAVAHSAGYRDLVTLPTSFGRPLAPPGPLPKPDVAPVPVSEPEAVPLPMPRPLPVGPPAAAAYEELLAPAMVAPRPRVEIRPPVQGEYLPELQQPITSSPKEPKALARPGWGLVDVQLMRGITIKWPAYYKPVQP